MTPFFSFVIPTYNRAYFIGKTIQSLLNQQYKNFEIIVVDDGSTDNTEEVVMAFDPSIVSFHKIPNCERGAARNYGARISKGDYINFFDSDDLAYPNHLDEAMNMIEKNNSPEIFHLYFDVKTEDGKFVNQVDLGTKKSINQWLIDLGNVLSCNGVFLRRDVALQFPFSENRLLSASEDYCLWLRLSSRFTIYHSAVKTSTIIQHEQRSVLKINCEKVIARFNTLLEELKADAHFMNYIGSRFHIIESEVYSYISLHFILTGYNTQGIKYLFIAIGRYPMFVFKHIRFMAIIKNLLKNLL
jgi:glycosyltransferase involved in cell wall biosynthesis